LHRLPALLLFLQAILCQRLPAGLQAGFAAFLHYQRIITGSAALLEHHGIIDVMRLLLHLCCMLQVLALAAVRATPQLTQRCRDIIAANLAAADAFFTRWSNIFEWHKPQGGAIAFPRIRTGDDVEQWCEQVVKECGVLLLPASVYDHEASVSHGHFRIGLGRQNMPQCLEQLEAWLAKKYRT
jgi:aspartate/methionine/tyrosine aminotransferase